MPNLKNVALLAGLSIGCLAARKFDKKETEALANRHGADKALLNLSKKLFTASDAYKEITSVRSKAREYFNDQTNPWDDAGRRVLPSASLMKVSQELRSMQLDFEAAVPKFIEQYPSLVNRDKLALNGLWRQEDYPPVHKLHKKFYFEVEYGPIPDVSDFRVDVGIEEMAVLRSQTEQMLRARIARSMEEPFRRLFDAVAHMNSRVQGSTTCPCRKCVGKTFTGAEFHDSAVENLSEVLAILPALNVTEDPRLAMLIEEARHGLACFKPDEIRASSGVKKTLQERAEELQNQMAAYFKAA